MYLKQTSVGPLVDEDVETAMTALKDLKKKGRLPGWSIGESGETASPEPAVDSVTFICRKKGDSTIYHYTFGRASKNDSWKLQRAWLTDADDKPLKEFPIQ